MSSALINKSRGLRGLLKVFDKRPCELWAQSKEDEGPNNYNYFVLDGFSRRSGFRENDHCQKFGSYLNPNPPRRQFSLPAVTRYYIHGLSG